MGNEFTKEDRELLIRVDERSERVEKWCYNHDAHHAKYMYLALSTTIGLAITLVILIIKVI
ncbi:MAG: hypothetical protein KJ587_20275 [Alphaproteobacteria bacterium]|nr:hypothetical protein [Alphaproteobacteria bacterium]